MCLLGSYHGLRHGVRESFTSPGLCFFGFVFSSEFSGMRSLYLQSCERSIEIIAKFQHATLQTTSQTFCKRFPMAMSQGAGRSSVDLCRCHLTTSYLLQLSSGGAGPPEVCAPRGAATSMHGYVCEPRD